MADSARTVLVFLDTPERLRTPARELLTTARAFGKVTAVAFTAPSANTLDELGAYGVTRVLVVDLIGSDADPHLTPVAAAALTAAVAETSAALVLFTTSFPNREIGALVARATGAGMLLDIAGLAVVDGTLVGSKRVFAGSWDVTCAVRTKLAVVTQRANAVIPEPAPVRTVPNVEQLVVPVGDSATATVLVSRTTNALGGADDARPMLSEAAFVVAGGRGTLGDFGPVEDLADALEGAVGATRDAVDEGWIAHDAQIGQTGVTIAPRVYIGAGISGAPHHRGGMQAASVVVAVNDDPDAPIFDIADFGVVGDLAKVLPQAAQAIRERKAARSA